MSTRQRSLWTTGEISSPQPVLLCTGRVTLNFPVVYFIDHIAGARNKFGFLIKGRLTLKLALCVARWWFTR